VANLPTSRPSATPADHGVVKDEFLALVDMIGWGAGQDAGEWVPNPWHCYTNLAWITAANRSRATPFWIEATGNYDAIAYEVTTSDAAGTAKFHRYGLNAAGYPGVKDIDSLATLVVTSTGIKIATFAASTEFVRGWHFIVLENTAGAARYRMDTIIHPRFHPGGQFGSVCIGPTKGGYENNIALADPWNGSLTTIVDCVALALRKV